MDIHYRLKELIEEKGLKCTVELEKEPHGDSIGLKRVAVTDFVRWVLLSELNLRGFYIQK